MKLAWGRLMLIVFICFAALGATPSGRTLVRKDSGVRLRAAVARTSFTENTPIELTVSVVNGGKKPIYFTESNSLIDYHIEVRDEHDQLAPLTRRGKELFTQAMWIGRRLTIELEPGQEKSERFQLNEIWEMHQGVYSIVAKRSVTTMPNKKIIQLTSNRLTVTVGV